MRNKADLRSQFKVLAQLMATIEETVKLHNGLAVDALDRIVVRHGLSQQGEEVLYSMLKQSERVGLNDDGSMLLVKEQVIDV